MLCNFSSIICSLSQVRSIGLDDFRNSLQKIRRSVPTSTLEKYESWNREYGDVTV